MADLVWSINQYHWVPACVSNMAFCLAVLYFKVKALVQFVFWKPMLFISFFSWDKRKDKEDKQLAVVKKINFHKELLIFILVLAASIGLGLLFTEIEPLIEGGWFDFTDMWYLDALAACFNVCNGLFLWLRYREQWIAWYGVIICESIFYIMSQNWALLVLELGYLTNTTYGFFKWGRYIKKHKNQDDYLGKDVAAKPEIAIE